jgi:prolyl oligopeptidase
MAQIKYPKTKKIDQTDNYHGTVVSDPYRWLEDDKSAETADWVKAQNEVTSEYLGKIPYRAKLQNRLEEIYNYPKYSAPSKKGEWFYFYKNNGLQNQSVLYRQKGLTAEPELVLDPNALSAEGTTRLMQFSISKNGKYAAYSLSSGGSDWMDVFVMDLDTKRNLSDKLEWVKISGLAWQGDGFYYSRYPKPEGSALAAKNENHQVWYHAVGSSQASDKLIYEDKNNPQRFHTLSTSEDEQFALLYISDRGKGLDGNALYFMKKGESTFSPVVAEVGNSAYSFIDNIGGKFMIQTNDAAPNEKLMWFDLKSKSMTEFLPERPEPLQGASTAGGKLFLNYLKDVTTRIYVYDLKGKLEKEVVLPGLGTAGGFGG